MRTGTTQSADRRCNGTVDDDLCHFHRHDVASGVDEPGALLRAAPAPLTDAISFVEAAPALAPGADPRRSVILIAAVCRVWRVTCISSIRNGFDPLVGLVDRAAQRPLAVDEIMPK